MRGNWIPLCPLCLHWMTEHRPELRVDGDEDVISIICPACEEDHFDKMEEDNYIYLEDESFEYVEVQSCVEFGLFNNNRLTRQTGGENVS